MHEINELSPLKKLDKQIISVLTGKANRKKCVFSSSI